MKNNASQRWTNKDFQNVAVFSPLKLAMLSNILFFKTTVLYWKEGGWGGGAKTLILNTQFLRLYWWTLSSQGVNGAQFSLQRWMYCHWAQGTSCFSPRSTSNWESINQLSKRSPLWNKPKVRWLAMITWTLSKGLFPEKIPLLERWNARIPLKHCPKSPLVINIMSSVTPNFTPEEVKVFQVN